eukprot:COSAG02_NODE_13524_length_1383_cov_1.232866_2_plen_193_part_00
MAGTALRPVSLVSSARNCSTTPTRIAASFSAVFVVLLIATTCCSSCCSRILRRRISSSSAATSPLRSGSVRVHLPRETSHSYVRGSDTGTSTESTSQPRGVSWSIEEATRAEQERAVRTLDGAWYAVRDLLVDCHGRSFLLKLWQTCLLSKWDPRVYTADDAQATSCRRNGKGKRTQTSLCSMIPLRVLVTT